MKSLIKIFCIVFLALTQFSSKATAVPTFVDSFDVGAEESQPRGFTFNNDGTKMFIVGWAGDDVNEYTLSTGFDLSTASYAGDGERFLVSQDETPIDLDFNSDGTKMYVVGWTDNDIHEYTLTTAFDVSTASAVATFDLSGVESHAQGIAFNSDGTLMFIIGSNGDDVNVYSLASAYVISTATLA